MAHIFLLGLETRRRRSRYSSVTELARRVAAKVLLRSAAGILLMPLVIAESFAEVGPARLTEALRAQPNQIYTFVIGFEEGVDWDAAALPMAKGAVDPIALVNGAVTTMRVADAFDLAAREDVLWVWYLHPDEATGTVNVLKGLDYTVATMPLPNLANMSLGPPSSFYRAEPEWDAPVPRALQAAANRGLIAVVAVGNEGDVAPGFVNPWSMVPGVISVGAWDHRTDGVWSGSSTGHPDIPEAWPDVVAPGVDVIGPWISARPKPDSHRVFDESHARFRETVPREDWDKYTMMTGTSQATAVVSGATAQVLRFVRGMVAEQGTQPGQPLFQLEAGPDRVNAYDAAVPRLTGTATPREDGGFTYTYSLDAPWKLIKQILIDTAIPIEGAEPWQAGAGLVDPDYIRAQFGAYGVEPPELLPVKVK